MAAQVVLLNNFKVGIQQIEGNISDFIVISSITDNAVPETSIWIENTSHDAVEVIFVDLIIELRNRGEEGQLCCRTLQISVHDLQQCLHVVRTIPIFLAWNHLQVSLRSYANRYLIFSVD